MLCRCSISTVDSRFFGTRTRQLLLPLLFNRILNFCGTFLDGSESPRDPRHLKSLSCLSLANRLHNLLLEFPENQRVIFYPPSNRVLPVQTREEENCTIFETKEILSRESLPFFVSSRRFAASLLDVSYTFTRVRVR